MVETSWFRNRSILSSHFFWDECKSEIIKKVNTVVVEFIISCQVCVKPIINPLKNQAMTINTEKPNQKGEPTMLLTKLDRAWNFL